MESLGIEETGDEASLLQESLSLKAFLRVNKESRREHLISTIESGSTPIKSPNQESLFTSSSAAPSISRAFGQEKRQASSSSFSTTSTSIKHSSQSNASSANMSNSHSKFSLSYAPTDDVLSTPRSPLPSNDYFSNDGMSRDESKLPGPPNFNHESPFSSSSDMDYLTDRDRSKVAENFNAMNTIINSTFKEKIDYQRKLRELQSELNVLKEKYQRLRNENVHFVKTIAKNKQSTLPLAMVSIYKKRRLATLRRGLARWQDFTRGSSLLYIQKVERDFQRREAEYVHSGRLVVMKLRTSAFRSLNIIYIRRRREIFRKAFSHWYLTGSVAAYNQQQKDLISTHSVNILSETHAKYRYFAGWRRIYIRARALHSLVRKLGIYDHKRTIRDSLVRWRGALKRRDQVKVLQTCTRTLLRHSPLASGFQIWKHRFCGLYYPHKIVVAKSIWRRSCRMRVQYLQASFSIWSSHYKRDKNEQRRVGIMIKNIRKLRCRLALQQWTISIEVMKDKQRHLCKVLHSISPKSLHSTKCISFLRWRHYSMCVERQKSAQALLEREQHMLMTSEHHSNKTSSLLASQARDTRTTLQCVKLVMTMMKLLACRQHRLHRLMVAFKRWSYLEVVVKSVESTVVVCYTHRIVMLMFARLKEKRMTAFTKWKQLVKYYHIKKRVILRMLSSHHKSNISSAFLKWKEFRYKHHVKTLYSQMEQTRVKTCISRWQHSRLSIPFRKWKATAAFLSSRMTVVSRVKNILTIYFLRMHFKKWHRSTVLHELLEQKSSLQKFQAVHCKNIEQSLENAVVKCKARLLFRWKLFTRHAQLIKKAILIRTKQTHLKIFKETLCYWRDVYFLRKKYYRGLYILHTLTSGANSIRLVKYFNFWARAVARQTRNEDINALTLLEKQHDECVHALLTSQSQCNDHNNAISQLTHSNSLYQLTLKKNTEYKDTFVRHLSNKKRVHLVFYRWKERFLLFKSNQKLLNSAVHHVFTRLDVYCTRQRFSHWKLKVNRSRLCLKIFKILDYKWLRLQVQSAFRRWQHHSLQSYMALVAESVRLKYTQMNTEVTFYQGETNNINTAILFLNKWKDFVRACVRRKRKIRECVLSIAKCKIVFAFRKWKHEHDCVEILVNASAKFVKAKVYVGFTHWKRTHIKVRKLDSVFRHLQKWQQRSTSGFFRVWREYLRVLKLQRMILRSLLLTQRKRAQSRVQRAFVRWVAMSTAVRGVYHKAEYLKSRLQEKSMQRVFAEWRHQYDRKKTYRGTREHVVHSVSQSLPVVRELYDVLFAADTVDASVALSTLAIEKILPGYTAEIYVMVSNTMLRASVPLKRSVNGTSSRFNNSSSSTSSSSHLFERERDTRPSPMDIPSSPIYQQLQHDLSSPPSPYSQGYILPPSSTGKPTPSPWTSEKKSPMKTTDPGGHLFHTPYEERLQHSENDNGHGNTEIVSVIVGRGPVGLCAKTGTYQVNRQFTSSSLSPVKHKHKHKQSRPQYSNQSGSRYEGRQEVVVSIVIPLISSGCIVGVLQLTPLPSHGREGQRDSLQEDEEQEFDPDAPVSFPYPPSYNPSSTLSSSSVSYPYPPHPLHHSAREAYDFPSQPQTHSPPEANSHTARFLKTAKTPIPPPQFTELVNMCIDLHISDISTISQLCIVVGTLSETLRMFIEGNAKKNEYMSVALAEKEQLEAYISQLHGEVATFEQSIEKSSKRIEHLEKSRLKYFNECKTFKDKADSYEKNYESLTDTLNMYKEKLEKYEDKKYSESVVMEKLHDSLAKATLEVFGTPAVSAGGHRQDYIAPTSFSASASSRGAGGIERGGGGGEENNLHKSLPLYGTNTSNMMTKNSDINFSSNHFGATYGSNDTNGGALHLNHLNGEDVSASNLYLPNHQHQLQTQQQQPNIRVNTEVPLASATNSPYGHQGMNTLNTRNTLNTLTTYDTSSQFSPTPTPTFPAYSGAGRGY